jgi:hypothetical protein
MDLTPEKSNLQQAGLHNEVLPNDDWAPSWTVLQGWRVL